MIIISLQCFIALKIHHYLCEAPAFSPITLSTCVSIGVLADFPLKVQSYAKV